jgi:putative endonuclease
MATDSLKVARPSSAHRISVIASAAKQSRTLVQGENATGLLRCARNDGFLALAWRPILSRKGKGRRIETAVANRRNGTLYTGVTSNLARRIYEHREGLTAGFTSRYGCKMLVWYEYYEDMPSAIAREKQIKAGARRKKLALIEELNPHWQDLYQDLI